MSCQGELPFRVERDEDRLTITLRAGGAVGWVVVRALFLIGAAAVFATPAAFFVVERVGLIAPVLNPQNAVVGACLGGGLTLLSLYCVTTDVGRLVRTERIEVSNRTAFVTTSTPWGTSAGRFLLGDASAVRLERHYEIGDEPPGRDEFTYYVRFVEPGGGVRVGGELRRAEAVALVDLLNSAADGRFGGAASPAAPSIPP